MTNAQPGAERPRPVLGRQPPLPGDNQTIVRYVSHEEYPEENALVPIQPYYEYYQTYETNQGMMFSSRN